MNYVLRRLCPIRCEMMACEVEHEQRRRSNVTGAQRNILLIDRERIMGSAPIFA